MITDKGYIIWFVANKTTRSVGYHIGYGKLDSITYHILEKTKDGIKNTVIEGVKPLYEYDFRINHCTYKTYETLEELIENHLTDVL